MCCPHYSKRLLALLPFFVLMGGALGAWAKDSVGVTVRVCATEFPTSQCSPIATSQVRIFLIGPLPDQAAREGTLSITMYSRDFYNVLPGSYRVSASGHESPQIEVASEDVFVSVRPQTAVPTPTPSCRGDFNEDGQVTVDEILMVVSEALHGFCQQ